ncbi:MAG TPA: tetratricopeptide repeat protein [Kofleriaceae bacterium]|nr:tetratricopeptide repeat protein [Kofleriaceae bacterium]
MGTRSHRPPGRRKLAVLVLGTIGLAAALTTAAFIAPDRAAAAVPTHLPADPSQVIATVPRRDPAELAARQALAGAPDRVDLAVDLARADIERYRTLSDPRYLGRAQATLGRWWTLAEPPPDVLLLRATIEQAIHRFPEARADLDRLIRLRPDDAQAQLTRAVVATITADYAAARDSCRAIAPLASPIVVATCEAPLEAIAGKADEAYTRLTRLVAAARSGDVGVRGWALTQLAELAYMRGDTGAACDHLAGALALDPDDAYARNLLADILMATGRAADASRLLAGRDQIDSHLVRRAIAEHDLHGPDAERLIAAMRDRIAAAAERGDRIHLREEARFALAVDRDAARAVRIARDNWSVQKELADARLLAEAAAVAGDREAAAPVIAWARATGVRDATLDRWLGRLGPESAEVAR